MKSKNKINLNYANKVIYIRRVILLMIIFMAILPGIKAEDLKNTSENRTKLIVTVEHENSNIWGVKIFFCKNHGFFLGAKGNFEKIDLKKYNFSRDRAETFYDSQFLGYSDREYSGFNIGYVYSVPGDIFLLYGGLGNLKYVQYRKYFDPTFTEWSNYYYIEDEMIDKNKLDLVSGVLVSLKNLTMDVGYSSATKGLVLGLGYRFNLY